MDLVGVFVAVVYFGLIIICVLVIIGFITFGFDILAVICEAYIHFTTKKRVERDKIMNILTKQ